MCDHWREYDNDDGYIYEYCKKAMRKTNCCGDIKFCWVQNKVVLKKDGDVCTMII